MTTDWTKPARPYSIAHRGASAYAPESSFRAFEIAAEMGADFWEADIRLSADNQLIVFHDAALPDGTEIKKASSAEIAEIAEKHQVSAPLLDDVLKLAGKHDTGIYADIKDNDALLPVMEALKTHNITRAILGAFDPNAAEILAQANCHYPRSALVPIWAEPFKHAEGADVIHLCWEHMERPQDLLDEAFFKRTEETGQLVVLWHEEDPVRMADLRPLPVLGICSDRPELVNPFQPPEDWPVEIVCHRGAEAYAPENTVEAAVCAFGAGFSHVELDVRTSKDGELVAFHDTTLDRTSTGEGPVSEQTFAVLRSLDAGTWFSPKFAGEKIATFQEILQTANLYDAHLYVELKQADPKKVLAEVKAHNMLEKCFFWSFDKSAMEQLREIEPEANIMMRRQDFSTLEEAVNFLNPTIIEYMPYDDISEFSQCRKLGCKVMFAYMGKTPEHIDAIIDARPDMVNLGDPFLFVQRLKNATR